MTALEGIRVLDLTRLLPGAVATRWLLDFGAEVIKIEQPGSGDYARQSHTGVFESTNRGKKSVTIDLSRATTSRHVLIPIPELSVGDISNGVPCSRHDCGKGKVSDFPSYAGFVPNLYLEIRALSGKPEIENAASRPATDFMLSGFKMPTTS